MSHVPTASAADSLAALAGVLLPVVGKGPIVRRPRVVNLAQRMDSDAMAVQAMKRLRDRYGPGPVQVRLPGRRFTFLLTPEDVHRVLRETPGTFTPATREKRGALNHFQPEGVLVSSPAERMRRRPFNEAVLESGETVHSQAGSMATAVEEEVACLHGHVEFTGVLTWGAFATAWWRIVRRVVLGNSARDDEQITDDLLRLRSNANFSFLRPRHRRLRERFLDQVSGYLTHAEPGSLAQAVARTPAAPGIDPRQQVPQWLFAFDAGAWAAFRALALFTSHPLLGDRARGEVDGAPDLPFLRAGVLESLRLWPTTPLILRDSTEVTTWSTGTLPPGASIVIFAPFFHRDEEALAEAHRFTPGLWLEGRADEDWPLLPFSGGPATCPGQNLVLLLTSSVLGKILAERIYAMTGAILAPDAPMPATLSPFALQFRPERAPVGPTT